MNLAPLVVVILILVSLHVINTKRSANFRSSSPLVVAHPAAGVVVREQSGSAPPVHFPLLDTNTGVFNPCSANIVLRDGSTTVLTALRVSDNTYCSFNHNSALRNYFRRVKSLFQFQNHVYVRWNSISARVALPKSWSSSINTLRGLEDPRVLSLADGVIGLLCTLYPEPRKACAMSLVILRLPDIQPEDGFLFPCAVIQLLPPPSGASGIEKNWIGAVHNDRIYMIRHVSPQQTVSVSLDEALQARGMLSWIVRNEEPLLPEVNLVSDRRIRGSSPLIRHTLYDTRVMLAVVHMRRSMHGIMRGSPNYDFAFIAADTTPPFTVRKMSRLFRISPSQGSFAYIAGLRFDEHGAILNMGVDDCDSTSMSIPTSQVEELFNDVDSKEIVEYNV